MYNLSNLGYLDYYCVIKITYIKRSSTSIDSYESVDYYFKSHFLTCKKKKMKIEFTKLSYKREEILTH